MPTKQTTGMYNEVQKREFINEVLGGNQKQTRVCELLFFALAPYEEELGGDIATRSAREISVALNKLLGLRVQSRYGKLSLVKKYIEWCVVKGYAQDAEKVDGIEIGSLTKIKNETVSSPQHLQIYLDTVFRPEELLTVDNMYRCVFWLAYSGVDENDSMSIRCSDIDLGNMVIVSNGFEYPIYREGLKSIKHCAAATQFTFIHENPYYETQRERSPGDFLLRGVSKNRSEKAIQVSISKMTRDAVSSGKTTMRLHYYRAWISGVFYRKYMLERAGVEVDFKDVAADFIRDKEYSLHGYPIDRRRKLLAVSNDYRKDYERWKAAHYIF